MSSQTEPKNTVILTDEIKKMITEMKSGLSYKDSKTVVVTGNATLPSSFSFSSQINIEFIPDEVIIKKVVIFDADAVNGAGASSGYVVKSNLISPNDKMYIYLPNFTESSVATTYYDTVYEDFPNIRFKLQKPINSSYMFYVSNANDTAFANAATFSTYVTMLLEFVKY